MKIPPPIWMLALLILAFVTDRVLGAVPLLRSTPVAVVLAIAGLGLASWARLLFASAGTEIIPASPTNKILVMQGPFRITRNPMYLGLVLLGFGIAFYAGTLAFFAVPVLLFLLCNFVVIPYEEEKMQRQFGDQYKDYRHNVRRWI